MWPICVLMKGLLKSLTFQRATLVLSNFVSHNTAKSDTGLRINSKSVDIHDTAPLDALCSGLADFRVSESCLILLQFPFLPEDFVALSFCSKMHGVYNPQIKRPNCAVNIGVLVAYAIPNTKVQLRFRFHS
jgi:molybdopterin-guanine dinucleotide biosynthesis protein A